MTQALSGHPPDRPIRLMVGVIDSLPKMVVYELLAAAFKSESPTQIVCEEGKLERLLADLVIHELDVVLADTPIPSTLRVQAYNHLLGESGVCFCDVRIGQGLSKGVSEVLTFSTFLITQSQYRPSPGFRKLVCSS